MKSKYILIPLILIVLAITGYFAYTYFQESGNQKIDQRYIDNSKFCKEDSDCISYTNCMSKIEPINKFFDNSFIQTYNPEQKCLLDTSAYAGNDTKCENSICKYKRCYPLWMINNNASNNQGISASVYFTKECASKKNKESCVIVDVYQASTDSFANPDGIPDCEWR